LRFVVTMLRFEFVYSLAPARPPRVSVITFTSYNISDGFFKGDLNLFVRG